jgi:methylmalonyl-CoA mutase N-terminal domain/subunit
VAYEALAAALGGAQSLHCCAYDEPLSLPTEGAHQIAVRTQQILAYETGVAGAADPLGGSYQVEALTDRLEAEGERILGEIDAQGGMYRAIESGWAERRMEEAAYRYQLEVERRERIVVGANAFVVPPEQDHAVPVHPRPTPEAVARRRAAVRAFRERRHAGATAAALRRLRHECGRGEAHNLIPALVDAVAAGVTLGEAVGVMRLAFGHAYDPAGRLQPAV